ncbi:hypothetical protein RJ639_030002 [Escallonia herrerae]|uniref:Pentatricopeptide repeat-containing protein n=1 Tax=Escallonia herrerae TaxID=1293975 RepID=A0AA89BD61_9ASTE|nr:hypothetical protein RJ639_030002 [Escallonia herrerae]
MKLYRSRPTNALQNHVAICVPQYFQPSNSTSLNAQTLVDARIIKTGFDPKTFRSNFHLKNLVRNGQVSDARQLFEQLPHRNTCSTNMLITGYVRSGDLSSAREFFDGMTVRTAVSWTIMIGGYSQHNQPLEAFRLYAGMCRWGTLPDYVAFATLLSGCDETVTVKGILQVHAHIVKLGYNFTLMFTKFDRRQYPFATMLSLAANTENVEMGRQIHAQALVTTAETEILVGNALVDILYQVYRLDLTLEKLFRKSRFIRVYFS